MVNVFSGVQFRKATDLQSATELLRHIVYTDLSWALEDFCGPASVEGGSSSFASFLFLLDNWAVNY